MIRWATACVVALTVAILALLLALDVGRWQTTFSRDDVRFKATPTRADLWQTDELLPFHAARSLLRRRRRHRVPPDAAQLLARPPTCELAHAAESRRVA